MYSTAPDSDCRFQAERHVAPMPATGGQIAASPWLDWARLTSPPPPPSQPYPRFSRSYVFLDEDEPAALLLQLSGE